MIKITSNSQLKKNKKFRLSIFKKPFCFKEKQKKYKLYEMPKFKSDFFKCKFGKKDIKEKFYLFQVQREVEIICFYQC